MVKTLPLNTALKSLELPQLERNLFSSPDWLAVIDKTYRTKLFVKYIEREGKVVSYIIYSVIRNFLEWKICFCSYCDYFDCYVQSPEDWQAFFDSLRKDYPRYRIAVRNLRDEHVREIPDLQFLSKERFHVVDIRDSLDVVWRRAHDSFKAAVHQGERNGIVVKACGHKDLKKFYNMHLSVRKYKYQIFPQPYRFFNIIWQQYMAQGKGVMLGAFSPSGELVAANIYLICGNTLYYKFNTSAKHALKLRPNNLLFWEGIKLAKEHGLEYVDLGSSGYDQEGLILFKNHTGAESMDIQHYGFAPEGYKFSQKRILSIMTKAFTVPWVPDFFLKIGSHLIYPFLG